MKVERAPRQSGFALISMLVAVGVAAILFSIIAPSTIKLVQVNGENTAAAQLAQIGLSETAFARNYGAYVNPQLLTGTLPTSAVPQSCSNSFLLNGAQIQSPSGYTMTFAPGPSQSGFSCPGVNGSTVNGLSTFQIILTPSNPLLAQRSFFMDQTGVVRFNDQRTANATDPPLSVPVSGSTGGNNGGSSGNTGTSGNIWGGTWTNGGSYPTGTIVLAPTTYNGSTGSAGPYLVIGSNAGSNYPPSDSTDFLFLGGGSPNYTPAPPPPPPCSSGVSGTLPAFIVPNSSGNGNGATGNLMLNACGPLTSFNVSFQTGTASNSTVGFQFNDSNAGAYISCNVYLGNGPSSGNLFSCSGPSQGGSGGSMTLNPGDNTFISFSSAENNNPPSISIQNFSWSLNP